MSWPIWIMRGLSDQSCSGCSRSLGSDSVVGVGARLLEQRSSGLRAGPTAFILLRCQKCWNTQTVEKVVVAPLVKDGVDALYRAVATHDVLSNPMRKGAAAHDPQLFH